MRLLYVIVLIAASIATTTHASESRENAVKLFENGWKWYAYTSERATRFKLVGQVQYAPVKEGDFFKLAKASNKTFLMDPEGRIFEPSWENNNNIEKNLDPADKYLSKLKNEASSLKQSLETISPKIKNCEERIKEMKTRRGKLVTELNENKRRNKDYNGSSIDSAINSMSSKIAREERELKQLRKSFDNAKKAINEAEDKAAQASARFAQLPQPPVVSKP